MTRAILFTVLTWTFLLACKEQRTSLPTTTVKTPLLNYATPVQPEPITEAPIVVNPPTFQQDDFPFGVYKYGEVKAVVVKRVSGYDYFVVEWMGGNDPDEGDRIQGELNRFGTKTCYYHSRSREPRLWVDDYRVSFSRAWEIMREKCDL
jgi:hypothetical protein